VNALKALIVACELYLLVCLSAQAVFSDLPAAVLIRH
jgi:hypothetical protein